MNVHRHIVRHTAAAAGVVLALGAIGIAPASGSGDVERSGTCTKGSHWSLKASPEDGRIRVEAEVNTGVVGQHWTWTILHNGGTSATGKATTKDGGSFKVERLLINVAGVDTIGWRSTNIVSKERCRGHLNF